MSGESRQRSSGSKEKDRFVRVRMYDGHRMVPYKVYRSRRAQSIRISIDRHYEIALTLPMRASESEGVAFLKTKEAWLRRHLSRKKEPITLREHLLKNPVVSIEGRSVPLALKPNGRGPVLRYSRGEPEVVVELGEGEVDEAELVSVLRGLATRVLEARTMTLAEQHGFEVLRVTVRNQSTRWGSCAHTGTVSLNWRLLLLPPEIQDYVILHELAHFKHMNHSSRYWAELCSLDPQARVRDRWLTRSGEAIMALGRGR